MIVVVIWKIWICFCFCICSGQKTSWLTAPRSHCPYCISHLPSVLVYLAANYVQCLSAYRGLRSLLKRDPGVAELDLSSVSGLHVFAFVFIVVGHRFGAYMTTVVINYEDVEYVSLFFTWFLQKSSNVCSISILNGLFQTNNIPILWC